MGQLIITVRDQKTGREFDTEVLNNIESDKLLDDLIQALQGANPSMYWNLSRTTLYSPRLQRNLRGNRTLREEGIWNGDYLFLKNV